MIWLNNFLWQWIPQVAHILGILNLSCHLFYFFLIKQFHTVASFCLAKSIKWKENADIWMERPEGLGNARGILQIFFLSGLDNRDPILGQQMEVVKSELLNGVSLWVKGLGAVPCKQPCFLPACSQDGRQLSEETGPPREKRSPNRPRVSRNE